MLAGHNSVKINKILMFSLPPLAAMRASIFHRRSIKKCFAGAVLALLAATGGMEADSCSLESKALVIADNLYRACVAPDSGRRLRESGCISPGSSLKQTRTSQAFEWVNQLNIKSASRYFTLAACEHGIKKLLERPGVVIPSVVGLPFELWLVQQARLVQHLCQRARKTIGSRLRFARLRQSRTMDWTETLAFEARFVGGRKEHNLKYLFFVVLFC